jgi:hypothetical protein
MGFDESLHSIASRLNPYLERSGATSGGGMEAIALVASCRDHAKLGCPVACFAMISLANEQQR